MAIALVKVLMFALTLVFSNPDHSERTQTLMTQVPQGSTCMMAEAASVKWLQANAKALSIISAYSDCNVVEIDVTLPLPGTA